MKNSSFAGALVAIVTIVCLSVILHHRDSLESDEKQMYEAGFENGELSVRDSINKSTNSVDTVYVVTTKE